MSRIDCDLVCSYCKKIFESNPVTLVPCGWVVCSHHLENEVNEIECLICKDHSIIKNNCISTKNIEIKYSRYNLEKSINDLRLDLYNLNFSKLQPETITNNYFSDILNQIKQQKIKSMLLIEEYYSNIEKTVLEFQLSCLENLKPNSNQLKQNVTFIEHKLKEIDVNIQNEKSAINLEKLVHKYKNNIEEYKIEFQNSISSLINYKSIELTSIPANIDLERIFGKIKFSDSNIFNKYFKQQLEKCPKNKPGWKCECCNLTNSDSSLNCYCCMEPKQSKKETIKKCHKWGCSTCFLNEQTYQDKNDIETEQENSLDLATLSFKTCDLSSSIESDVNKPLLESEAYKMFINHINQKEILSSSTYKDNSQELDKINFNFVTSLNLTPENEPFRFSGTNKKEFKKTPNVYFRRRSNFFNNGSKCNMNAQDLFKWNNLNFCF